MRIDEYGVLRSEILPVGPGQIGDSCANTARWIHLLHILGEAVNPVLTQFITKTGYVRHPSPELPMDWRESDFSGDQALAFYLAANEEQRSQMKLRTKNSGYRFGNGDILSPIFYAVLVNSQWKINMCLIAQLALFSISIRWSDEHKWFESSVGASGDTLNWFHCLPLASQWVRKLVNKEHVKSKVHSYFANENNVKWYLDLYDRAIEQVLP